MQCYTELTAPTAVTHCLSLPFLSPSANNLIVAKSSLLQIFSLKSVVSQNPSSSSPASDQVTSPTTGKPLDRLPTTKLILIAQYELSGTITSLARVKILNSKSGAEALLVALKDAKLSLIEWDPERYSISTISIHYYEREDILSNPWEPDLSQCVNYLSVDPGSRCAVLKFGSRHLAILPFHQVGDDLVMAQFDGDLDEEKADQETSSMKPSALQKTDTPYASSFVLSLLALDPVLTHPQHLTFLYEYSEPTFGILYSQRAPSTALLYERKDVMSYAVYTIDIEQRASTTLLSVNKLPSDLRRIVPLSRAVGGVLLVGVNELVHVDQSGKTSGVAVNDMAKQSTSFAMADQSDLAIKLEHCIIKQLGGDNTDLLLISSTGELAIISFKIDGRSVSKVSVQRIADEHGGQCLSAGASCASLIGRGRMFVGSELGDSVVLGWSRTAEKLKRQPSQSAMEIEPEDEGADLYGEDFEDEDDLYSTEKKDGEAHQNGSSSMDDSSEAQYSFRIHDSLLNVAPLKSPILMNGSRSRSAHADESLNFIAATGQGEAGGLTHFQQRVHLQPETQFPVSGASSAWAFSPKAIPNKKDLISGHSRYMIISSAQYEKEISQVMSLADGDLEELTGTDFDPEAGKTLEVGLLNEGTRIIQILLNEVRAYDTDLGLAQIFPLADEDNSSPPYVVGTSFADPFILIAKSDGSLSFLRADESGDLDEIEQSDALTNQKWISGCLYEDLNDVFRLEFSDDEEDVSNVLAFLSSASGGLHIFRLPGLQRPVYVADGLTFLPPFLSAEFTVRRSAARDRVVEILVAELGDGTHKSPFLILRSYLDDIILYQPYQYSSDGSKDTTLRFLKIPNTKLSEMTRQPSRRISRKQSLRIIQDHNGFDVVFKTGPSPALILKSASSSPQVFRIAGPPIRHISRISTPNCVNGILSISEDGQANIVTLPPNASYSTGFITTTIPLNSTVSVFCHHAPSETFVLGTSAPHAFKMPEEDIHPHDQRAPEDTTILPTTSQSSIQLLDQKTHHTISTHSLQDPFETILCISAVNLETSEHTHAQQDLIAIGTAILKGEDTATIGRIYIYSIIPVVPDPDSPYPAETTSKALKLLSKEEVRGPVTALCGVGTQGFLLVAQGQKVMVRGLKEDGSFLPVAFLDMQCYVTVTKELGGGSGGGGEGLCLLGDAVKGLWLTGYMEDPYILRVFGKAPAHLPCLAADFLPDGNGEDAKNLYVVIADGECNLHVLQFDPENPKSLSGTRLLPLTSFHTGHFPSSLALLPPHSANGNNDNNNPSHSEGTSRTILLTTKSGLLATLTNLPPNSPDLHRTLTSLASHALTNLTHPLGLNPRAYRYGMVASSMAGSGMGGAGGVGVGGGNAGGAGGPFGTTAVIDGNLVRRWQEGGRWKIWGGGGGGGVGEDKMDIDGDGGGDADGEGDSGNKMDGELAGGGGSAMAEIRKAIRIATEL